MKTSRPVDARLLADGEDPGLQSELGTEYTRLTGGCHEHAARFGHPQERDVPRSVGFRCACVSRPRDHPLERTSRAKYCPSALNQSRYSGPVSEFPLRACSDHKSATFPEALAFGARVYLVHEITLHVVRSKTLLTRNLGSLHCTNSDLGSLYPPTGRFPGFLNAQASTAPVLCNEVTPNYV
eukprot:scaffold66001_cov30-Phaeocystis_antarctica.AAC.1